MNANLAIISKQEDSSAHSALEGITVKEDRKDALNVQKALILLKELRVANSQSKDQFINRIMGFKGDIVKIPITIGFYKDAAGDI